jgi:hypothetical protein
VCCSHLYPSYVGSVAWRIMVWGWLQAKMWDDLKNN